LSGRILKASRWAAALVAVGAMAPAITNAQTGPDNVVMSFNNLAPLDEAAEGHYEGWAIVGGSPISTGKFNVDMGGQPVELGGGPVIGEFDAGVDVSGATAIVITVEPFDDTDPGPSSIKILRGDVSSSMADLVTNVPGLGTLETSSTGAFILATPSDNPDMPDNDNMGIWFLTMPGPEPGFMKLPDIGPDWTYEGWAVDLSGPTPYSTGTFATAEGFDSDEAGCMGGGPPFPGEDFVPLHCGPVLTLDSGNFAAVITIEPVPDNRAAPFQLHPFASPIPKDALGRNNEIANQTADTFPTGTAMLYVTPTATEGASWGSVKTRY
jgi:hypothetical protein